MSGQINLYEELTGMKEALWGFLSGYFDGLPHSVGAAPVTFPKADVVFTRPELAVALPRPVIYCAPVGGGLRRRRGRTTIDGVTSWNLVVLVAKEHSASAGGTVYRAGRLHDLIASQIGLLLTSCRYVLAGYGLRCIKPGDAVPVQSGPLFTSYREVKLYPRFAPVVEEEA
ncbi:MAG: hypothetical protein ABIH03_14830 [Pseudomonadota bacterium]